MASECSHTLRGIAVVLCRDGNFDKPLFRRDWPYFLAFDLLAVDGEDLRELPVSDRKRRLRSGMPRIESRLLYADHVAERGTALFCAACKE
jgi:ATP-dependent DNA ligase